MTNVPDNLKYTKKHEWARIEGNRVTIGITDHAQGELTDIVYIELPKVGQDVEVGTELATVESVKSTSDIYSPVSGKIVEVNSNLENSPGDINTDAYGKGWLVVIECADVASAELMTAAEYKALLG
ncbi:MAG: glycine cleavage system protein GcvH [Candidatus Thermoplasmatota archaeon]|nr:glycine cleavage system protein GcvH [Euryarchaeota archaeon]MBU4031514.1 glycine cleavage system protein GcvH [Candidatus Thermoplasmatota archaeon]MBU4071977.1 glycine cleavage system protein GcvH [Candidatus Thermoplasmatota archaeon]MBU4143843.1 glycine cleavage system protein GcvH [Candidatus Thermoplasmatota archaeon]MBU4590973.1 glycine cleavage system protein GcvH [Candidatus Thermoplasmatota archaeon]